LNIYIIGSGWNGCHTALYLTKKGHSVTILEKNTDIFQGTSGQFGIRLHSGPHYPRSEATRESCRRGGLEFKRRYPELVIPHQYSIYGLGSLDSDNHPPKVSQEVFEAVCHESPECEFINTSSWGYQGLICAANLDEPSIVLGRCLRERFRTLLIQSGVNILFNVTVTSVINTEENQVIINLNNNESIICDCVINATGYQAALPQNVEFPLNIQVAYQPCLALKYRDKKPEERPFSFIIMDGWFPCLMPYVTGEEGQNDQYILTHGKWTILGSFNTPEKANKILNTLSNEYIETEIKTRCEEQMSRFWPEFSSRFEFLGWEGSVLAKINTKSEFRSAVTYSEKNIIHIIPGKVTNIFDVENEIQCLLDNKNIISQGAYSYVLNGVLDKSMQEVLEKSTESDRSTYSLKTFKELNQSSSIPLFSQSSLKKEAEQRDCNPDINQIQPNPSVK
jgi:hypothetical protein